MCITLNTKIDTKIRWKWHLGMSLTQWISLLKLAYHHHSLPRACDSWWYEQLIHNYCNAQQNGEIKLHKGTSLHILAIGLWLGENRKVHASFNYVTSVCVCNVLCEAKRTKPIKFLVHERGETWCAWGV